ncbi:MAG: hypothetical protein QOI16_2231, partial [Pseudonocardiales bacterium]|nr:hypothetical protein [Pseudonocardiales bacterium]
MLVYECPVGGVVRTVWGWSDSP